MAIQLLFSLGNLYGGMTCSPAIVVGTMCLTFAIALVCEGSEVEAHRLSFVSRMAKLSPVWQQLCQAGSGLHYHTNPHANDKTSALWFQNGRPSTRCSLLHFEIFNFFT